MYKLRMFAVIPVLIFAFFGLGGAAMAQESESGVEPTGATEDPSAHVSGNAYIININGNGNIVIIGDTINLGELPTPPSDDDANGGDDANGDDADDTGGDDANGDDADDTGGDDAGDANGEDGVDDTDDANGEDGVDDTDDANGEDNVDDTEDTTGEDGVDDVEDTSGEDAVDDVEDTTGDEPVDDGEDATGEDVVEDTEDGVDEDESTPFGNRPANSLNERGDRGLRRGLDIAPGLNDMDFSNVPGQMDAEAPAQAR